MTLATKNGSLIVKDGKVAENCNCCGDWWCYDGASDQVCRCICDDPAATLPNVLTFTCATGDWGSRPGGAFPLLPDPDTGGPLSLLLVPSSSPCVSRSWAGEYSSGGVVVHVLVSGNRTDVDTTLYGEGVNLVWTAPNGGYDHTFINSNGRFSAAAGKTFLEDMCSGRTATGVPRDFYTYSVTRGD